MKQAIRCIACDTVVRLNETYAVNVREVTTSPLTGEKKTGEVKWRMCKPCAKKAGYKVKGAVRKSGAE